MRNVEASDREARRLDLRDGTRTRARVTVWAHRTNNGVVILSSALRDLMDAAPRGEIVSNIRAIAEHVPDLLAVEKLLVWRTGTNYHVAIHVQASPTTPLSEAHQLGGRVKAAIQQAIPQVSRVLVHMEPFEATHWT